MAIPPISRFSSIYGTRPSSPKNSSSLGQTPEGQAYQAEKDARTRITNAENSAEEAERDADAQIDHIHDEYLGRESAEQARQSEAIEKQKSKGYEEIRDLKRAQQAELSRMRRDGERDIGTLKNYYDSTLYNTEKNGKKRMNDILRQQAQETDYEQKSGSLALEDVRKTQAQQLEQLKDSEEGKYHAIESAAHKEYERLRENVAQANQEAEKKFQANYEDTLAKDHNIIDSLNNRASQEIRNIRQDTAAKLAAYSERQNDPFYKLVDLRGKLYDEGDHFMLTALIPEHEQNHVTVSLKGDNLVVSGYRRNEEKLEVEPGHYQGTSAYQSYQETFPLTWPVDGRQLTREFDGDTLIVKVPKKNEHVYRPRESPKPARARVERPQFPENIPHVKSERTPNSPDSPDSDESPSKPVEKSPGSIPLT